jgi:hypothetical protein
LFGATHPFNQNITELLQKRKTAINTKDEVQKNQIEKELIEINPQYFNFLKKNERNRKRKFKTFCES